MGAQRESQIDIGNELYQLTLKRVLITVGFSFAILIDLLYTWGGWEFDAASVIDFQSLLYVWSLPLLLTNALVFMLLALVSGRLFRKHIRLIIVLSAALIIVGHLLIEMCAHASEPTLSFSIAAICIGSGCSILLGAWVIIFSGNTTAVNHVLIMLSLAVSAVLFVLINRIPAQVAVYVAPVLVVAVVVTALVIIRIDKAITTSALAPNSDAKILAPNSDLKTRTGSGRPIGRAIMLLREPLFCAASIIFAVPMTRISAFMDFVSVEMMNLVTAIVVIVTVAVLFILRYGPGRNLSLLRNFDIPRLFHFSLPLVATALVLYTVVGQALALPVGVVVFVLFYLVWLLMIPTCIEAAQKLGTNPLLCYGVVGFVVNVVFAGSTWLGATIIAGGDMFGVATLSVCMLLVLYVLMMVFTFNHRSKRSQAAKSAPGQGDLLSDNPSAIPALFNTGAGAHSSGSVYLDGPDLAVHMSKSTEALCLGLSEQNGLTPRENDILTLLAVGRDIPHIASQLFISKNTVRTHAKSVYVKLDVHSRQELLDLLDGLRAGS